MTYTLNLSLRAKAASMAEIQAAMSAVTSTLPRGVEFNDALIYFSTDGVTHGNVAPLNEAESVKKINAAPVATAAASGPSSADSVSVPATAQAPAHEPPAEAAQPVIHPADNPEAGAPWEDQDDTPNEVTIRAHLEALVSVDSSRRAAIGKLIRKSGVSTLSDMNATQRAAFWTELQTTYPT